MYILTYRFLNPRSLMLMGVLTVAGTGFGAYIMAMAALSPCPLLVHHELGAALMVRLLPVTCLSTPIVIQSHTNRQNINIFMNYANSMSCISLLTESYN